MPIITPGSLYVLNVSLSSITYYKWNIVTSIDCVIYRHIIDNQLKFTHCKEHMLQNGHVCAYLTTVASALFNFGVTISLSLAPVPVKGHSSGLKVHYRVALFNACLLRIFKQKSYVTQHSHTVSCLFQCDIVENKFYTEELSGFV